MAQRMRHGRWGVMIRGIYSDICHGLDAGRNGGICHHNLTEGQVLSALAEGHSPVDGIDQGGRQDVFKPWASSPIRPSSVATLPADGSPRPSLTYNRDGLLRRARWPGSTDSRGGYRQAMRRSAVLIHVPELRRGRPLVSDERPQIRSHSVP